jgi:invasion protein IalB
MVFEKTHVKFLISSLLLGFLLLFSSATFAQDIPWKKRCSTANVCEVYQLLVAENKQRFLEFVISLPQDKGGIKSVIVAPLNVFLPEGVKVNLDKTTHSLVYQTCTNNGCIASFNIGADYLKKMKASDKMIVQIYTMDKKPINVELSLKGFTKVYDDAFGKN